jgi:hypothetical protein
VLQVGSDRIGGDNKHTLGLEVAKLKDEGNFGFGLSQFINHPVFGRRQRETLLPLFLDKARPSEEDINFILAQYLETLRSGGFRLLLGSIC